MHELSETLTGEIVGHFTAKGGNPKAVLSQHYVHVYGLGLHSFAGSP